MEELWSVITSLVELFKSPTIWIVGAIILLPTIIILAIKKLK